MKAKEKTKVVLVDDHRLFRKGMLELLTDFEEFTVIWEAENGKDFIQKLANLPVPEIVLLDINMPVMDGFQTAAWLSDNYPDIKTLALSMHNDEATIMRMLKAGVNGYILKNAEPAELKNALLKLQKTGTYYTAKVAELLVKSMRPYKETEADLSEREIAFLQLACTELPYKAFAPLLQIHPRVVESVRETLFRKLAVESRVGLVIYAIKHGIYNVE